MQHAPRPNDIFTPRLLLRLLDHAFLDACLRGRVAEARALLGADVPTAWLAEVDFIARRWQQLRTEPEYAPFAPRALLCRDAPGVDLRMVGHCGFHSAPDAAYLGEHAALRSHLHAGPMVEIGYTLFVGDRGRGYATEAVRGMAAWAHAQHGVRCLVASIAPGNAASQRLAARLGFVRVGGHVDVVDGPEDVLVWTLPA